MKSIEFVRIDERLVHGQILTKWIKYTKCDEVIVLDDNMYDDPIMKSVMKMSFPRDIPFEVYSVKTGAQEVLSRLKEEKNILLLMKNLSTLKDAFNAGLIFQTVNIARLPFGPGRQKLLNNIYISNYDLEVIKKLLKNNVKFIVQMVPDSEVIDLGEVLKYEK